MEEESSSADAVRWQCAVCGYIHEGDAPPEVCPQCSSFRSEFSLLGSRGKRLEFDGKDFDVLLINGSMHTSHNTAAITTMAEGALRQKGVSYRRFDLKNFLIEHCWCCYSMAERECTYPCRNQNDDMPAFHRMLESSRAVIIVSPINWNNMPALLKDFLDRTTCLQNMPLIGRESLTSGKVLGIFINGHEDGALKTAMDIFVYFQQMGYVLAPFGFGYRTHGAAHRSESDIGFFSSDSKLKSDIYGIVNNVVEMLKLDPAQIRNRLKPVSE